MIKDENKIIFDKPQNFVNGNKKIKNDVKNKKILLNSKTIYYACITNITIQDETITTEITTTDGTEYTTTTTKTPEQGEIPAFPAINEQKPEYQQAIQTIIQEALRAYNTDNTLPTSQEITTLEQQVATLTEENETLTGQVATLTEDKQTLTGQVASLTETNGTLSGEVESLTAENAELNNYIEFLQSQFTEEELTALRATYDAQQEETNNENQENQEP